MMTMRKLVSPVDRAATNSRANLNNLDRDDVSGFNVSGTEAFILVSLVIGLFLVSLVTTITCLFIIFKLQLFPGSELITFDSQNNVIFRTNIDLNKVHLNQNVIRGVETISGNVHFQVGSSKLSVNSSGIQISSEEGFKIKSPTTGQTIFPPDFSSLLIPSSLSSLTIENGGKNVKRIRSPVDEDLNIQSERSVHLRGNQGVRIDSKSISFSAPEVHITSHNSSVTFEAPNGHIYWKGAHNSSVTFEAPNGHIYWKGEDVRRISSGSKVGHELQFKLCICSKSGRVFRLQMKTSETSCSDVRFPESVNPCS